MSSAIGHYCVHHHMNGSDGPFPSAHGPTLPANALLPSTSAPGGWVCGVSSVEQQPTSAEATGAHPPPSTCGPFVVGPHRVYLQPAASPAEDVLRQQNLMNTLLAQAPDYGAALFEQCTDKMACFARLDRVDLANILKDSSPGSLLDSLWSDYQLQLQQNHVADGQQQADQPRSLQDQQQHPPQQTLEHHQQEDIVYHPSVWPQQEQQSISEDDVYYPPPPPQQEPLQQRVGYPPRPDQQQQHDSTKFQQDPGLAQSVHHQQQQQQQQQQIDVAAVNKVSGPRDLAPAAAAAFGAALPTALLPDNWQDISRWGTFEMECKFTVAGSDKAAIQDLRTRFNQAKEAAIAATQVGRQQQQQQQQANISSADYQAGYTSSSSSGLAPRVQSCNVSVSATAANSTDVAYAAQAKAETNVIHGSRPSSSGRGRSPSSVRVSTFRPQQLKVYGSKGNKAEEVNSSDAGRRERLVVKLHSRAPEYAAALPQQEDKFAELSRIVSADLDVILQQQQPDQVLEDAYRHICRTRHMRMGQSQQNHPNAAAVKPFNIPLQLRQHFEELLPPGALPEFWMTFQTWQQLESKVNINAFGPPSNQGSGAEEAKAAFSRAVSEIIQAVVEDSSLQPLPGQQQQEPGPCELPDDLADQFAAEIPDGWLPREWQQCGNWSELFEQVYPRAWKRDRVRQPYVKQRFWDATAAVIREYAASTGHQQHNGQQLCAEDYSVLVDTSADYDRSGLDGQQQGPGQQQQQSRQKNHSVRPCDLPPVIASQFAAAVQGRLPDDWQHCTNWKSLEALVKLGRNRLEARRQFRAAKIAASDAYKDWLQLQQQPPAALDSHSSSHTAHHPQAAKRTVAPCDLPAAAASLLESLVPDGVLPGSWQAYPTWSDLDVAVCHTAGGTDPKAVNDSIRRFKEAKQAALAAAADGTNHSPDGMQQLQLQQQPDAGSLADTSSITPGSNSYKDTAGATAPPRFSVSWAQAAAGSSQDAAGTVPAPTMQAHSSLGGTAAVPAQQPISRSSSGDASSHTNATQRSNHSTSNTESGNNSRLGNSSTSVASRSGSSCRAAPAARAPENSKYVPAHDRICAKCGARGHAAEQCSTPYCPSCTQWGHADGADCLVACHFCGRIHQSAGYVRCEEKICGNCQLIGHRWFECPHIMCGLCKCYGHTLRDCRACRECKEWASHSAEQCPGFCRNCNVAGHRTADCRVKRCVQCGKVGCVVGMCSGFAACNSSRSRADRGRGNSGSAAGTTAVAAAGLFNVREVTFDLADSAEQEQERRQLLVSKLMEVPGLDDYACALITEEAAQKLAVLATISAADLSLILQQKNPAGLLDQICSMQAAAAATKSAPAAAAAGHSSLLNQSPQQQSGVMQQQSGTAIMPCDLGHKHTHILEGRLPAGSLPADWFEYDTWFALEREFIECFKATHVRGSGVPLQDRRIAFRRARQYVQAVAAGTIPESRLDSPRRQEQREPDKQQDRQHKPDGNDAKDTPPATQQRWQQQQQQTQQLVNCDGWPVVEQHEPRTSSDGWPVVEQHDAPISSDGWPVVEQQSQHAKPATSDGWAVDEQPQQSAIRATAWARKLNLLQPETTQAQHTAGDWQQQQQSADHSDQVHYAAEYLQQKPAEAELVHAVSAEAAVPAAHPPPGDSQTRQQQSEHQQRSGALPAYSAAGAAVMPMIGQLSPVHPLHFPHHQVQRHPLQLDVPPQQQQQPAPAAAGKVLGPRDLTPAAAAAFEASLPPGLLPEHWRSLPKWGAFEMECKFTVAGSNPEVIQDLRTRFKQAREAAKADTQAERAVIAQPPRQEQQPQQQAPWQIPQQPDQLARGAPPGFPATIPPPVTSLVAPSPIYVLGHQALQQQHPEPVMGIPVGSMGMPAGSMYPPAYPPPVASSTAAVYVPGHPSQLMVRPAMMPQYAAMQHYGAPVQRMPAATVPAAALHAAAMALPQGVAVGHVGAHMTAVGHGPPGPSSASTAAAGVGSDEDLDDILNLCGA